MIQIVSQQCFDSVEALTIPIMFLFLIHDDIGWQQKFAKYLVLKNAGRSFNEELRKSKGYRNPDFLQRAVKYKEIDQIGSCFKKEIFDPHGYDPSDFYDALGQSPYLKLFHQVCEIEILSYIFNSCKL